MKRMVFAALLALAFAANLWADEGMWTLDNPPTKQMKEKYNFAPSQEWLDHARLSCVRFMNGGSGSFASKDGLVLTNHHVAFDQLQKLSSPEHNYAENGFVAATRDQEIKCPDLEVNVLISMENVTDRVIGAATKEMDKSEALKARREMIGKIEHENAGDESQRADVVNLYNGGEYWLYKYKKYTDVRLVMAPERALAYFGGDYDNFTFPRWNLDFTLFRVYENGKPLNSANFLKWNLAGPKENDLTIVMGNPGHTRRSSTYAQLIYSRDFSSPLSLKIIDERIRIAREYSKLGEEQRRRALDEIMMLENSRKARAGAYQGLLNEQILNRKKAEEQEFMRLVAANPELQKEFGSVWKDIEELLEKQKANLKRNSLSYNMYSGLASIAQTMAEYANEIAKPDDERKAGFHDFELEELKFYLLSPAPIYKDLEIATMSGMLNLALKEVGKNDEFLAKLLAGKTPEALAKEIIGGTKLDDPEFRKKLIEGGADAILGSDDPMLRKAIEMKPLINAHSEEFKKEYESQISAASQRIAKARFAVYGKNLYPDATFTFRLSYGAAKGYKMNGTIAPYKTTLYGLFDRSASFGNVGDFIIPNSLSSKMSSIDLSTPVNFVASNDVVGGNSGSPMISREGELIGLVFDGNIESLLGDFIYDGESNRTLAVHPAFIMTALRTIYPAKHLADEIEGK